MLKIRFVLCHRNDDISGEIRQIFLAAKMRAFGHDASVFTVSLQSDLVVQEPDGVTYFPADSLQVSPHDTLSTAMLEALSRERPDVIIVKGIDYALARAIFTVFPTQQLAVIIGGISDHPLLRQSHLVFFETKRQLERYEGMAVKRVLPKFMPWEHVIEHGAGEPEFDIVNVGNFDEDRKAQELLLAFSLTKKVLLIGAGRKLDSFREICRDRPNVTFSGFVSPPVLFQYLSRSRLMVHCSTWDGYPRAVAEGLSAGVPVIGLRGVLDGIAPEPLIRTAPLEQLHSLVFSALERPEELAAAGKQAREHMRKTSAPDELASVFQEGLACIFGAI